MILFNKLLFYLRTLFFLCLLASVFVSDAMDVKRDDIEGDKTNSISENSEYPGVVKITIPGRTNGTGLFVAPDILVTDFHIIAKMRTSIKDSGFFFSNSTLGFINATDFIKIRSLDKKYDLAVLKLEGYQSSFFYSLDSSIDPQKDIKPGVELKMVGFPVARDLKRYADFYAEEGKFLGSGYFGDSAFLRMDSRNGKSFPGMSGGPVFFNDRLAGLNILTDHHGTVFVSTQQVKRLLSEPDLSCSSASCITEERGTFLSMGHMGDRTVQFFIGLEYMRKGDNNEAAEWFRKAAVQNVYEAQFYLAKLIAEGKVGSKELLKVISEEKDLPQELEIEYQKLIKEARYWIEKAAIEGKSSDAQLFLGISYANGFLDLTKSLDTAFYWYKEAAAQNHHGVIQQVKAIIEDTEISAELKKEANQFLEIFHSRKGFSLSLKAEKNSVKGIKGDHGGNCFGIF